MLVGLLLLFLVPFVQEAKRIVKRTKTDEVNLNKETERGLRSEKVTKVWFYCVKVQLTSVLQGPEVAISTEKVPKLLELS